MFRFFENFQTGPRAHTASFIMGNGSISRGGGVKQLGRGLNYPPPSSTEVKERVEIFLYFFLEPSWPVLGDFFLYI